MSQRPRSPNDLRRLRENQRRSRARRREYVQELEEKCRKFENAGAEASSTMQKAARRVLEDNFRLRELLRSKNVGDDEINGVAAFGTHSSFESHSLVPDAMRTIRGMLPPQAAEAAPSSPSPSQTADLANTADASPGPRDLADISSVRPLHSSQHSLPPLVTQTDDDGGPNFEGSAEITSPDPSFAPGYGTVSPRSTEAPLRASLNPEQWSFPHIPTAHNSPTNFQGDNMRGTTTQTQNLYHNNEHWGRQFAGAPQVASINSLQYTIDNNYMIESSSVAPSMSRPFEVDSRMQVRNQRDNNLPRTSSTVPQTESAQLSDVQGGLN